MAKDSSKDPVNETAAIFSVGKRKEGTLVAYNKPRPTGTQASWQTSEPENTQTVTAVNVINVRYASSDPYSAKGLSASQTNSTSRDFEDTVQQPNTGARRIYELAERYVDVFQSQGAADLTPEQRSAMVAEIAFFYSAPSRAGRLEALVGAFEVG
jgi:hypothetical protein